MAASISGGKVRKPEPPKRGRVKHVGLEFHNGGGVTSTIRFHPKGHVAAHVSGAATAMPENEGMEA